MERTQVEQFYELEIKEFVELSRFEQKRKHKRPRINKKWRKRYGFSSERFRLPLQDFSPKLFKKYDKVFLLDAKAYPKQERLRFPVMDRMPVYSSMDAPNDSVSYEVKEIHLQRFGYAERSSHPAMLKNIAYKAKELLLHEIRKQNIEL